MKKIRIFLADDHAIVRQGIRLLIGQQPDMEVVGEAANGREAVTKAKSLVPDVLITDISMPECDGVKATLELKQACPEMKVLALTVHDDEEFLRQLLKAGATGYLLKRAGSEELIQAIRTIAAGGVYLAPEMTFSFLSSISKETGNARLMQLGELSSRETEVLKHIARGDSVKEIASNLSISAKTVETYKARLMEKLNLHSRSDIVRYASRHGWLQDI